jgi:hypothetical protein
MQLFVGVIYRYGLVGVFTSTLITAG